MIRFALHGGAGDLPDNGDTREHRAVLQRIAQRARDALAAGAPALDVVEEAVAAMEDCPLFNAGTGGTLTSDGVAELDAAIMDGARRVGALTGVTRLANPVRVARRLLEHGSPVFLSGTGAERYAVAQGFVLVDPHTLIVPERLEQLEVARRAGRMMLDHDEDPPRPGGDAAFGTVGAVARDTQGRLAAATSTGGLTNKAPGRIGDSPVIGAGTYADDRSLAVSCTGTGESFIRAGFAHALHAQLTLGGRTLAQACALVMDDVASLGGRGGCIAIDRDGRVATPFNSNAMFRAWTAEDGTLHIAVHDHEARA